MICKCGLREHPVNGGNWKINDSNTAGVILIQFSDFSEMPPGYGSWVRLALHKKDMDLFLQHLDHPLVELLKKCLPFVEEQALMLDALDRHKPLRPGDQAQITEIANEAWEVAVEIAKTIGVESRLSANISPQAPAVAVDGQEEGKDVEK